MKSTTYNTLKNILIGALIVINLGCVWFIFQDHRKMQDAPRDRQKGRFEAKLKKDIGLDDAQVKAFMEMKKKHMQEMHIKMSRVQDLRKKMFDGLDNPNFNIDAQTDSIAQSQKELDMMVFAHFRELKTICRPDQYEAFDKAMERIQARINKKKF
ncbi:periplasmic heavy metal sensor [Reichenbachiella agariperforans]|uniref:Heavy-metal resistance n=1 Tax=Reichenbachiella agariperforans TaxID=156994 RepID=A0A1M6R9A1_REIAG|nr:periplasmic heavy metal sensor [Reichenbachiella agariperforans]MBU2912862.1 periplasmic heavy metal sensor [Reichenbachiella agariperforans]SHK29010.1 hypothetical protein SAMN04488028_10484 [Reichenbachiella agariperforans]